MKLTSVIRRLIDLRTEASMPILIAILATLTPAFVLADDGVSISITKPKVTTTYKRFKAASYWGSEGLVQDKSEQTVASICERHNTRLIPGNYSTGPNEWDIGTGACGIWNPFQGGGYWTLWVPATVFPESSCAPDFSYQMPWNYTACSPHCPDGTQEVAGICRTRCPLGVACITSAEGKAKGSPPSCERAGGGISLSVGNPINAGTGDKFQSQSVYEGVGPGALRYQLSFTSRQTTDTYHPSYGHGKYWIGAHERRLYPDPTTAPTVKPDAVSALRGDGRILGFQRQTDGTYRADADIADRLEPVLNAALEVVGWRIVSTVGDETERYDATGRLVSTQDRAGKTTTLQYDANQRLAAITDPWGRALTLAYDASNRVASITPPDGLAITFTYSAASNLTGIAWPDGKTRVFHYENAAFPNNLTGITDENAVRYATWNYDAQGRAIASQHAGGVDNHGVSYAANATTVTDPLGSVRTHNLTTILDVVRSTGVSQPGGSGCGPAASAISYDANGNVASRTDFNGNLTTYAYDLARNLETRRTEASGTPLARTVSTQWHPTYRLPTAIAEPNKLTSFTYDAAGNRLSRTEQATTDANGSQGFAAVTTGTPRTSVWTYNAAGQVLTADGPRTDVTDVTLYAYYPDADPDLGKRGNLARVTNALGHVTEITAYDPNGRPLALLDPNGVVTTLAYDARGRLVSRSVAGETTAYQYDGVGQLLRVTQPDGSELLYTYDPAHRLTEIADSLGNRIVYTLDPAGNRTREDVRDPLGALARTRTAVFDGLSRLQHSIGALGQTTQFMYDAQGNLTDTIDPLGKTTHHTWDALNRLVQVTDPALGQIRNAYDGQDRLVQVTDPRNLVTAYTIDGLGNQTQLQSPDTGTATSTYDDAGNHRTRTDAKGQTTTWQYDALNRVVLTSYADGFQVRNTWDQGTNGIGRLTQVEELQAGNVVASTSTTYDARGRIAGETRQEGALALTTQYLYSAGRLAALIYPSGKRIDYQYDPAGRINSVRLTDGSTSTVLATGITYHPFGGIKQWTNGAGQVQRRAQDQDGRTIEYTLGDRSWQIGYDAASRITHQVDTTDATQLASYGYDPLDRLTTAILPTVIHSYGYDATGNRTLKGTGVATRTYATSPTSNRLLGIDTAPPTTFSYDANGSLIGDGTKSLAYDARGRLTGATTAAGTTHYRIDAAGRRVGKSGGGQDRRFTYDPSGHLIAESDAAGQAKREVIWLNDTPIAVIQ